MATRLGPRLRFLLVFLQEARPPRPRRQSSAPPPFPREGPGIGAAPQGLRPDSRTLSRGAPYKGMVGAERAAAVHWPRPSGPPPASEWRSSAPPQDHLSRALSPHLRLCWSLRRPRSPQVSPQECSTFPSQDKTLFCLLPVVLENVKGPDNQTTPRNVSAQ